MMKTTMEFEIKDVGFMIDADNGKIFAEKLGEKVVEGSFDWGAKIGKYAAVFFNGGWCGAKRDFLGSSFITEQFTREKIERNGRENFQTVVEIPQNVLNDLSEIWKNSRFPQMDVPVIEEIIKEDQRYLVLLLPTGEKWVLRHNPKYKPVSVQSDGSATDFDADYEGAKKVVSIEARAVGKYSDKGDEQIQVFGVNWSDNKSYSVDCAILPVVPFGDDLRTQIEKDQDQYDQVEKNLLEGFVCTGGYWELDYSKTQRISYRPAARTMIGHFDSELHEGKIDGKTVYLERFGNVWKLWADQETVERAWLNYAEKYPITPEDSRVWLEKYSECVGSEFHFWNSRRNS